MSDSRRSAHAHASNFPSMKGPSARIRRGLLRVLLVTASVLLAPAAHAQTVIWSDTFEDTLAPSSGTRTPENDGPAGAASASYFKRTDNSGILVDFGSYAGVQGAKFWAGEDHDGAFGPGTEEQQIDFTGINIAGQSGLEFRGLFAARSAVPVWDYPSDYVIVECRVDGGAWQPVLRFFSNNDTIIKQLALDTNGDGLGDGTIVQQTFAEFTASLPTGNTLDLRLRVFANGTAEEWAVDNFRVVSAGSDTTAPTVTGVTANTPNGTYDVNGFMTIQVSFSEIVTVVGTPQLTLETGSPDRTLSYVGGTGTSVLSFDYLVQSGESSLDLDYTSSAALTLNGGTIRDGANNNAVLTLAVPGTPNSLGANKNIVVSTSAVTLWSDTFEDTGAPSSGVRTPENNGGLGSPPYASYFVRTNNSGIQTSFSGYTRVEGAKFWAGQDHDGAFGTGTEEQQIDFTGINIAGQSNLQFRGWFAANPGSFWENALFGQTHTDYLIVEYRVDGGSYQTLLSFRPNHTTLKQLARDTDNDGIGDGLPLTSAFTSYVAALPTGTTLDLRLRAYANGTTEEWAVDNFRIAYPDSTPPQVSSVSSTALNGTYNAGDILGITVTFNEAVSVTGTPVLTLETGTVDRAVAFTSASASTLTFQYTVQTGDLSTDLDYTSTSALSLAGTIIDGAGNSAVRTLPSPGAAGSLASNKNLVIDAVAPVVTSASANGAYRSAFTGGISATDAGSGIASYSASGLPTGLSVTSGTGAITGTPTQSGVFSVTINALDNAGNTGSGTLSLTIAKVALTITGVVANGRVYDGTTTAPLTVGGAILNGVISPDVINIGGTAAGAFADRHVATGKAVTVTGFTITGTASSHYTLSQPTGLTANVTAKSLSTSGVTAVSRIYDATTVATLSGTPVLLTAEAPGAGTTADGRPYTGDTVSPGGTAAGTLADRHAGIGKPVTVSGVTLIGAQAGNYTLVQPAGLSANITPKSLTASGLTAVGRVYDATTAATLSGTAALQAAQTVGTGNTTDGRPYTGDVVALSGTPAGTFADSSASVGKTVTISGLTLGGAQALNYTLASPTTTATITPLALTVTGITANDRVYDATTIATINIAGAALSGVLGGDGVAPSAGGATGAFANKNIGNGKTVTISGVSLSGTHAANYTAIQPATTANITEAGLSATGITAVSRVYDGTTSATIGTGSASLSGLFGGDSVVLDTGSATGVFANKDAGTNKTVLIAGLTISGADAPNYLFTQPTTTANITAAPLAITGVTASDRSYDATTVATLLTAGATLNGVITPDDVNLGGVATGSFANRHAGIAKPVTASGFTISGTSSSNYTISQPTGLTASITAKALSVTGLTGVDRIYDATTIAILSGTPALAAFEAPGAGSTIDGRPYSGDAVSAGGTPAGAFGDRHAFPGKAVTVSGVTLSGAQAANYTVVQPAGITATITPKQLTVSGLVTADRIYDTTSVAAISGTAVWQAPEAPGAGNTADGRPYTGDTVMPAGTPSGAFASKIAGVGRIVTISGLTLDGTEAGNYALTAPTTTATISPAGLAVSGITANDKVYDATTVATLNVAGATLNGVLGTDVVASNASGATGAFADRHVGAGKPVAISGAALSGADASNYTLTQPSSTATIIEAGLGVTGITASSKVYDGTTLATLVTGTAGLSGVFPGDGVILDTNAATGAFIDRNAGTNKVVNISGVTIAGAHAGNYLVVQPTTTADITVATLTVSGVTASDRIYDGSTTNALVTGSAVLSGVINPDTVVLGGTATGTFADRHVGTNKPVTVSGFTLSGPSSSNYTVSPPAGLTASITAKALTSGGVTASDKVYDATTVATLAGTASLQPAGAPGTGGTGDGKPYTGDVLILSGTLSGTFADRHAATAKPVIAGGLTLGGTHAGNYALVQPTALTANITAKSLVAGGLVATDKVYDATVAATLSGVAVLLPFEAPGTGTTVDGRPYTGDTVAPDGTPIGSFADKTAGVGKSVVITGLTLTGAQAGNYTLTPPVTTATITSAGLTVNGITANDKAYDTTAVAALSTGSAALIGVFGGDLVVPDTSGATGTFADANAGTGKPVTISGVGLSGTDAGNYTLTQPASVASITAAGLTVTGITATDRIYDTTTSATLVTSGGALSGVLNAEPVTLDTGSAAGAFVNKNVGLNKLVNISGLTIGGGGAGNYTLTQPTTTASITPANLTVTGVTANDKTYDGNATATLVTTGASLNGVLGIDGVSLTPAGASGTFADPAVGSGKTVTISGLTTTGVDSGNYTLVQPVTTASITAAGLSVAGITASDKTYDTTVLAALNTGSASLAGVLGGDSVTLDTGGAAGVFANKNAGVAKMVSVSGILIGGAHASNYTLSQPSASATITAASATVTGITASDKVYDTTNAASLNTGAATLSGILAGDVVSLVTTGAVGTFDTALAGTNKAVAVSALSLSGLDAMNYALTQPSTTASITAAGLSVTGIAANGKIYDGTTTATLSTGAAALAGVLGADAVSLNTTGAAGTFADENAGTGKAVTISGVAIGGAAAANYTLSQPTASADITPAGINVTGITAQNKVYDGTTAATINTAGALLAGVLIPDVVTLDSTSAIGTFDSSSAGTAKMVAISGLTISGPDSANYSLNQPSTTADIAPVPASIVLGDLLQLYDGSPRSASATTTPPGLAVAFTYNGSPAAPVASGSYIVVGTITDGNYQGTASETMIVIAGVVGVTGPAAGTYLPGQTLTFTVAYSGIVTVTGAPVIELVIGSATHQAAYVSGSGTDTLIFRYTVQSGDVDPDGITVVSPIALNGGAIFDTTANAAGLAFTPPGTSAVILAAAFAEIPAVSDWALIALFVLLALSTMRTLRGSGV